MGLFSPPEQLIYLDIVSARVRSLRACVPNHASLDVVNIRIVAPCEVLQIAPSFCTVSGSNKVPPKHAKEEVLCSRGNRFDLAQPLPSAPTVITNKRPDDRVETILMDEF